MQPLSWITMLVFRGVIFLGKRSQAKGRAGELELARILQDYGYPVEPGHALNYGKEPDLSGLPGIHCEVKRCEQLRLSEWLAQAVRDAEKFGDGLPVIFHRKNREPWLVTMRLTDWLKVYRPKEGEKHDSRGIDPSGNPDRN